MGAPPGIGSAVELEWDDGQRSIYVIASEGTSAVDAGVISADSRLAKAIRGARAGDSRSFAVRDRVWTVVVVNIEWCGTNGC